MELTGVVLYYPGTSTGSNVRNCQCIRQLESDTGSVRSLIRPILQKFTIFCRVSTKNSQIFVGFPQKFVNFRGLMDSSSDELISGSETLQKLAPNWLYRSDKLATFQTFSLFESRIFSETVLESRIFSFFVFESRIFSETTWVRTCVTTLFSKSSLFKKTI